jgi:hypothetical protein
MLRVKERVGVLPGVDTDYYPSGNTSGVVQVDIDVDSSSGTVRVVPTIVDSCLELPLVPGDALPAYRPSEIVYGGKRYIFREPLECVFHWDDECADCLWIECAALDLFSTGHTVSEAISRFNEKFGVYYECNKELLEAGERLGGPLAMQHRKMTEAIMSELPVVSSEKVTSINH